MQRNEKKLICLAMFDPEIINISIEEKELLCKEICAAVCKTKKIEVIDRDVMHLTLLKNNFQSNIYDINTAVDAGKLFKADKVTISVCEKSGALWHISIKLIDVETTAIDTTLDFNGSREQIVKKTTSAFKQILSIDINDIIIRKRGFWITCGGVFAGVVIALKLDKKSEEVVTERKLPKPSKFP